MSKSIVVYHQMKNNLLQSHGVQGTRYNLNNDNTKLSNENFEENFNSLLLSNNPDNTGIGGSVEDAKGIGLNCSSNALT